MCVVHMESRLSGSIRNFNNVVVATPALFEMSPFSGAEFQEVRPSRRDVGILNPRIAAVSLL